MLMCINLKVYLTLLLIIKKIWEGRMVGTRNKALMFWQWYEYIQNMLIKKTIGGKTLSKVGYFLAMVHKYSAMSIKKMFGETGVLFDLGVEISPPSPPT